MSWISPANQRHRIVPRAPPDARNIEVRHYRQSRLDHRRFRAALMMKR